MYVLVAALTLILTVSLTARPSAIPPGIRPVLGVDIGRDDTNCGNGILETGEECDDRGNRDGDGCSATCQIEPWD